MIEKAYRVYVTDAVRLISENTAKYGGGNYMAKRFSDFFEPPKEETRTPEEIRDNIRTKLAAL